MIDLFLRLRHLFFLLFLLTLSIIFMAYGNSELMWGVRAQTLQLVWAIESRMNQIAEIQHSVSENKKLRDENLNLTTELARLRNISRENEELRHSIEWRENNKFETIPARIITRGGFGPRGHFVLDVGRDQGVQKNMSVISHQGILGRIIHVSNNHSRVMPYLHAKFHVPVIIDTLGAVGILSGQGSMPDSLILENVIKTEPVEKGQHVITHYASEIFPPNIPVGTIADIKTQPGRNFFQIKISPAAPLHTTHFAFVVKRPEQADIPAELLPDS